ncbi:MAG: hypothetical protein HONBIEJF_00635 [Fimbriimonadaceae bacterium]|nr:hypothetical protein [Fimbriimonadaceae bacterium]
MDMRSISILTLLSVSALAPADPAKSLYDRLGGIHKIAAAVDWAVDEEAKDEMLLKSPNYKSAITTAPRPFVKFMVVNYVASMTGGPQKSPYDVPSLCKWFAYTPEQNEHAWQLRWKGFERLGVDREAFMELRKTFEAREQAAKPMAPPTTEIFKDSKSLYARLGGIAPITLVINDFVNLLGADPVIGSNPNTVRALTSGNVSHGGLKYLLTEQVAQATGGPFKYTGRSMKDSHKGLKISDKEWEVAGGLLKQVLDKYNVPLKEQNELFAVIASTRDDIVGK